MIDLNFDRRKLATLVSLAVFLLLMTRFLFIPAIIALIVAVLSWFLWRNDK